MISMRKEKTRKNTDSPYEEVIRRNSDMVYRLAFSLVRTRSDADDIYQEVFLRYVQKEPAFQGAEHEKAWFLRVTINCCKNFWKSPWMLRRVPMESGKMADAAAKKEASIYGMDDSSAALIDAVKRLPAKYRVVIHLFYYEDLSVEEIGKLTGAKASMGAGRPSCPDREEQHQPGNHNAGGSHPFSGKRGGNHHLDAGCGRQHTGFGTRRDGFV